MEPPRSVAALLESFDEAPASYVRVARQFERDKGYRQGLRELRVALLSTFTLDLLSPYLVVEGARRGLAVRPTVAPFGQLEQQILDADSALYRSEPEVVVLAVRVEDAAPALAHAFVGLSAEAIEREVAELVARIDGLIRAVHERSNALVLVWNQVLPRRLAAGIADTGLDLSQTDAIADLNRQIARACRVVPGALVFDVCRVSTEVGLAAWEDSKLAFLARAPLSAAAQIATAKHLARTLRALIVPPCKCLALDLDNTLWGGVLGEDGVGGIALGEDYPGNVYMDFQRQLVSYRDRGILLAIASKNNEADVLELFERRHGDLVLRLEDFAARQIHWNDKAGSLAAIANELNIGTDSLAFFDDDPVEREWVRTRMPEVHVIEVPPDPLRYAVAIEASGVFDVLMLTSEDRTRANQYRDDQRRRTLASSSSVEDFLRALDMRVHIGAVDVTTLPRVTQLIAKTNQFNLTTRRHAQPDVERMVAAGAIALWMRVEDRFGDNGLVGVALALEQAPDAFTIDTFLMSCRVMGRKAETALVAALARQARARGALWLYGVFIPSKKNAPAAGFLPEHGFQPVAGEDGCWRLDLSQDELRTEHLYQVIDNP